MSKQKKSQPSQATNSFRNFKLTHQRLSITDVNFKKQTLAGYTEFTIIPLTSTGKLWKLCLNCKQCRIIRITVNGHLKANYSYMDPTLRICPLDAKKRNLEFYDSCHHAKVKSCDTDCSSNAGELIVKIPKDAYSAVDLEGQPLIVKIDFSLEQPLGGVRFVIPSVENAEAMKHAHAYSFGLANSSRLWFPCVDSYSEPCLWDISFVVPANMVAVSCGELTETVLSFDGKKKTFNYSLPIPTVAPCIGFAIGCFEVYPDPVMQEVTHFCLPGLLPILKNTVQIVHQVFGFYEEILSSRFPYSSYNLVFVADYYAESASYSTLGLFNTNLLHSARIVDQVMITRKTISSAIAMQYFGCYVLHQSWNDWWLLCGISGYLSSLFCRKMFGSTEYKHWVMSEQGKVCDYESENTLPPLCGALSPLQLTDSSPIANNRLCLHPKLLSWQELEILIAKAHLVVRMIQLKIGQDLLLQVFNKLLTLASSASQSKEYAQWSNLLVTTEGFMKLLMTVSGKDMSSFLEQWVCSSGVPRLQASYTFVRKKNFVELKVKQMVPHRSSKFAGSMSVIVQEFDGCFSHNIQVEDLVSTHELPCHSKIRKAKKRKVPLIHGEEIDIDISNLDNEVPILWVRVDPDFQWIRQLSTEQSDTTWQNMLKYERDAMAQLDALQALGEYPSNLTRDCFRDTILNSCFYYQVRLQAAESLAKYLVDTSSTGSSPSFLISIFQRLFGSSSQQSIIRLNDFSDVASYFLQKGLISSITNIKNMHKQCPKEVFNFIMDLFKFNDNEGNKYTADHYTSCLMDALAMTITPKVSVSLQVGVNFNKTPAAGLTRDAQMILQEIVQHLNIEKVLPSYKYTITCSCLRCLRVLQKNGHLPNESRIFREYTEKHHFIDVRIVAVKAIADIVQAEQSESDLEFLLQIAENAEPQMRLEVLYSLAASPPFTRRTESTLCNLPLVERLWAMMSTSFYYDNRLRSAAVQLYASLFNRLTPSCVPQGLGVVIDLKEKVARSNISSPITTPRSLQDMKTAFTPAVASIPEDPSAVQVSALPPPAPAGDISPPTSPSSPIRPQSPSEEALPLLKVTVLDQNLPHHHSGNGSGSSSGGSSKMAVRHHSPLSLKISTSHLKRLSPSTGGEGRDSRSYTASPESTLSTGMLSDDSPLAGANASPSHHVGVAGVSPSHQHRHKRHKGEHKEHKHKHKKKKGKKSKHKHKHSSSHDIDVET